MKGAAEPLVSIILCVRNGLPHVREAVESVRALTYKNLELVVQDGASTDGTREFLESVHDLPLTVVSAADSGIGQAFNRALQRCCGEIIGSVDADNRLRPDAVDKVVRRFAEHQDAAVVYGGCDMIAEDGAFIHTWTAPDFDLLGLIDGSLVPPFATSFFSRETCGAALAFDESFATVADFDLWLRLAHLRIVRVFDVLADVRVGPQSSTWTPDMYEKQCYYKLLALRRFVAGSGRDALLSILAERAEAGIHLWAVDSMATIGGGREYVDRYFNEAGAADFRSERFRRIVSAAHPTLPADPAFRARVLSLALEHVRRGMPGAALTYLEMLQAWATPPPTLDELLQLPPMTRNEQIALCDEIMKCDGEGRERAIETLRQGLYVEVQEPAIVRARLQAEVDKRDQILNELHTALTTSEERMYRQIREIQEERIAAVNLRDQIIVELRARLLKNRIRRFLRMAPAD
jgi:glycosyltransferase involved in cell wall biosynthesis